MKHFLISLLGFLVVSNLVAGELTLPEKLPGDTNVVVHLNFARVKEQPPVKDLEANFGQKYTQIKLFLKQGLGFDIDKIKEAWLFGPSFDDCVVVFKGDFDLFAIGEKATNNPQFEIVKRPGCNMAILLPDKGVKKVNMAAIFDKSTIAFGKTAYVEGYLDAISGKDKIFTPEQMKNTRAFFKNDADLTAVLLRTPDNADDGMKNVFKQVDSLMFEFNVEKDLKGRATAEAKTEQKAEAIRSLALGFLQLVLAEPDKNPILDTLKKETLKHLKVSSKGRKVTIEAALSEGELNKIVMMLSKFAVESPK